MDIVSLIVAAVTSIFLVIIVRMFFYIIRKYSDVNKSFSEIKELHKNMKDEIIIIRAIHQIELEKYGYTVQGLQVTTPQQNIQIQQEKLFNKLKKVYINLPDWKVREKINNFFLININDDKT